MYPYHRIQNNNTYIYTIKSSISEQWRRRIVKASDEKIEKAIESADEWKKLRHNCTNYDSLIKSKRFKALTGIEEAIAYWTLHYYCTLFGLQEQVNYFRNRYEACLSLIEKYRKELDKLNNLQDNEADLKFKVQELERDNAKMKKNITSLRKSVSQYKVWNERYRNQLNK